MTFMNCQRCRRQAKAVYRAYNKVYDLKVCEPCASVAWESGLTIEALDLVSPAKSKRIFSKGHMHRLVLFQPRLRAVIY
jgi:hypothetical protein